MSIGKLFVALIFSLIIGFTSNVVLADDNTTSASGSDLTVEEIILGSVCAKDDLGGEWDLNVDGGNITGFRNAQSICRQYSVTGNYRDNGGRIEFSMNFNGISVDPEFCCKAGSVSGTVLSVTPLSAKGNGSGITSCASREYIWTSCD